MLAKGETLGQIAMRYGITTAEIMAWNDIDDPTRIHAGRILVVRGGEEQVLQPQQKAEITATRLESQVRGNFVEHKIKPGETLGGIASLYRVSLADLKAWNNIADPRSIKAGKSVKIMRSREVVMGAGKEDADSTSFTLPSGPSMPEHESSMEAASVEPQTTYTVRSGDTLWGIARKHNVTIAQIQQWNELKDPSAVKPGKKLTILKK
jgi:LysM repeat protein